MRILDCIPQFKLDLEPLQQTFVHVFVHHEVAIRSMLEHDLVAVSRLRDFFRFSNDQHQAFDSFARRRNLHDVTDAALRDLIALFNAIRLWNVEKLREIRALGNLILRRLQQIFSDNEPRAFLH